MHLQHTPQITLTESEVFLLFNIFEHIATNATKHKSEFVLSQCEFLFEVDYGMYESFQNVRHKVREQATSVMIKNYPGKM